MVSVFSSSGAFVMFLLLFVFWVFFVILTDGNDVIVELLYKTVNVIRQVFFFYSPFVFFI